MHRRISAVVVVLILLSASVAMARPVDRTLDRSRLLVRVAPSKADRPLDLAALEASAGVGILQAQPYGPAGYQLLDVTDVPGKLDDVLAGLLADPQVEYASGVYTSALGLSDFPTPEILVRFEKDISSSQQLDVVGRYPSLEVLDQDFGGMRGCLRLGSSLRSGLAVLDLVESLADQGDVAWAESDWVAGVRSETAPTPNDPKWPDLWGLKNTGQIVNGITGVADRDVDADEAWDKTYGDPSVVIVVFDDGVQQNHPDIQQIAGADFTDNPGVNGGPVTTCDNHGTQMAGCITGSINNALGIVGVAPGCRVASARIVSKAVPCNGTGVLQFSWMVNALSWAQTIGAKVTCNSNSFDFSQAISDAYAQTRANGMVHFGSTGNDGASSINFPASDPSVMAIGAVRVNGARRPNSNYGPGLFAMAPGEGIWTTDRTGSDGNDPGDYYAVNGTSPAAAYAAGVASLLVSAVGNLSPQQIESTLAISADDWFGGGYDEITGYGIVNANNAIGEIGDVWVDGSVAVSGTGSYDSPYKTVGEAATLAPLGSKVAIRTGTYFETLTLTRQLVYRAADGTVMIGP
jgi:thermitase